jgi:hypothetical protein
MEIISFVVYFGFMSSNFKYENISFNENIDYCTNIIHDPRKEDEFLKNCDLKETNNYIMIVKKGVN